MGERPGLEPESAEPSVTDGGRLVADRRIRRVPLTSKKKLAFDEWEELEAGYLARLGGREPLAEILDADPFPALRGSSWEKQGEEFVDARDGSQFGVVMAWVGDTIGAMRNGHAPRPPGRPWSAAFDRAERRSRKPTTTREVFGDWLADEIWSLKWAEDYHFSLARAELATRLAIAEDICARLRAEGSRADRAAAESIMMLEVVGESDYWTEVKDRMRVS
jgi:hypothetical protein